MRTKLRSKVTLLFMTCAVLLAVPAIALADIVADSINDVSTSVGSRTIVAGESTSVGYKIQNQNTNAGDTQNNCNPADGTAANLAFNVTNVTASPNPLVISQCSNQFSNATFSSEKSGTYTITPQVTDAGGGVYQTSPATWSLTVNKAKTQLTNVQGNGVSGQSNGHVQATLSSFKTDGTTVNKNLEGKTVTFKIDGNTVGTDVTDAAGLAELNNVNLSGVSAGGHNLTADFAGDDGYLASTGGGPMNVLPPPDSTAPVINHTLNPASPPNGANGWYKSDVSLTWSVTDPESPNSITKTGCVDQNITSDQAATTYSCSATSPGGSAGPVNVTIKLDATPPTNIQFAGGPDAGGSYAFGSVPDEPTCDANFDVSGKASCVVSGYSQEVSAPGSHTMTATATDNAGNVATQTRNYTVTKANQAPLTVTSPNGGTYGQHLPIVTSGGTTNGAVSFQATGACQIDDDNKLEITDGMGTCSVTATMAGNANYNDVTSDPHLVAVNKRSVTVTADAKSKTYGEDDPELTYDITNGSLVNSDSFSGALTRQAGETVADSPYAILQGTLSLPTSKYDLTYVGANFTINARPITVTADAKSKTYGEDDPELTYDITNGNLVGSDTLSGSLTRQAGESVAGSPYAIQQGTLTAGSNYTLNYVGANFTINARPITITADAKSKLFGDPDPPLTYKHTSGTLVGSDQITGNLTRDPGELVGQYNINQGTVSAGPNYAINYVGAMLTIGAWTTKGFYQPVDMSTATTTVWNTVKGGSTVPLKFELFKGTTELTDTANVKPVQSTKVSCSTGAGVEDAIETVATGGTSLRYDTTGGQFIYNWKTPTGANTCYKVTVTANDGSTISAFFKMK